MGIVIFLLSLIVVAVIAKRRVREKLLIVRANEQKRLKEQLEQGAFKDIVFLLSQPSESLSMVYFEGVKIRYYVNDRCFLKVGRGFFCRPVSDQPPQKEKSSIFMKDQRRAIDQKEDSQNTVGSTRDLAYENWETFLAFCKDVEHFVIDQSEKEKKVFGDLMGFSVFEMDLSNGQDHGQNVLDRMIQKFIQGYQEQEQGTIDFLNKP